jgi:hypothetical protein
VHSSLRRLAEKSCRALLGAAAVVAALIAAGCHSNASNSGYGVAWVTLADDPGDFTSYVVNIDSITLTRNDGAIVTLIGTAETVDFTQLTDFSELYSSAVIPDGVYVSASVTIDYTGAVITVLKNGVPTAATVVGPTGAAVTTVAVTVTFDANNPLNITPSYASTHAERIAFDFHAATSSAVNLAASPPTVTVNPWFTAAVAPADTRPIHVRGPLINSSASLGTYTVYVRPFHDEVNSLGSLTLFGQPSTIYTIDGKTYTGASGLDLLTTLSAGVTVTAAYTTLIPQPAPATGSPSVAGTAGVFQANEVIAGNSLENTVTQRLTGVVIARSGNTLTLGDSTLSVNSGAFSYNVAATHVLVDDLTTVTLDGQPGATLTAAAIAVGQHIEAIGVYQLPATGVVTIDATGASGNNGTVRLQPTQLYGTLVAGGTGSLTLNLQTIDNLPATYFDFAGNGATAAATPLPAAFAVGTGSFDAAALAAATPLWINGFGAPFGTAPPAFNAVTGGVVQEAAEPAVLRAAWSAGTTAPFTVAAASGLVVNLANTALTSAVISVGPEQIPLDTLAASPTIEPTTTPAATTGAFPSFLPAFALGTSAAGITVHNDFASFVSALGTAVASASKVTYLEARGTFDRATNVFVADSIDLID